MIMLPIGEWRMEVTVAATQMACCWDTDANVDRDERLLHQAADSGAQVILIQELFETPYSCIDQQGRHLVLAEIAVYRREWCVYRDRRPDLYRPLLTLDGVQVVPGA